MYAIYAGDVCVYNDVFTLEDRKVVNPKLTLEDNAAGSLTMTLPPSNVGYSAIARLTTDILVKKDGEDFWAGRVLSEGKDFWNNRTLTCEGELAFFNDSTQPPAEHSGLTVRGFIEELLAVHNAKVPANRRITLGAVTVHDSACPTRYTNNEKTITLLNSLVEKYGGHLRVRRVNGAGVLDYLAEYPDTASQVIQFGSNLVDFTRNWDSTEFATVIVPLGARLDESPIEALDAYLTVESVNEGSRYIQSTGAVNAYGWIEKTVNWDDVTDPSVLLEKGKAYLSEVQFDNLELELSALDLHYLNADAEAVKLLDEIRVISRPHGLDRLFPVTKLVIPLDSPEKTQFTLGATVRTSLTGVNNQTSAAILKAIEGLPKAHSILKEAKENATAIMNMATTGYITITKDDYGSDTLYISNIRDYTKATKLWKWNMNGLGYSNDGGKTFGLAITMDGAIVADYITAGTMSANRVRTGVLESVNKNTIFNLDTGELTMRKGSIYIGKGGNGEDIFSVDSDGYLYARRGTFAGTLEAAKGTFGGVVQAADFLDKYGRSMMTVNKDKIGAQYLDLKGITVRDYYGNISFQVDGFGNVTIGAVNALSQTVNGMSLDVINNGTFSTISLMRNGYAASSATIMFNGMVTFNDLSNGTRSFINGGAIDTNTLYLDTLYGNTIYLKTWSGSIAATISTTEASSAGSAFDLRAESIRLTSGFGDVYLKSGGGCDLQISSTVRVGGTLYSSVRGDLGQSYWPWGNIYADTNTIQTSDRKAKEDIAYGLDRYDALFDALRPASFRFKNGASGRTHLGLIAQDVEDALEKCGLTGKDFAGFVKTFDFDKGDFCYALRYGELISLCVEQIQNLKARLAALEQERGWK